MSDIEKHNKFIAEFMGARPTTFNDGTEGHTFWNKEGVSGRSGCFHDGSTNYFKYKDGYNNSWDWIIPVIEKIESLGYTFTLKKSEAQLEGYKYDSTFFSNDSKIHAAYEVVVDFVYYAHLKQIK